MDYSKFNNVTAVETSPASAKERASGAYKPSAASDDTEDSEEGVEPVSGGAMAMASQGRPQVPMYPVVYPPGYGEQSNARSMSIVSTSSRANGVASAMALAAFDLQKEFAPTGIDEFSAQINDICQFSA